MTVAAAVLVAAVVSGLFVKMVDRRRVPEDAASLPRSTPVALARFWAWAAIVVFSIGGLLRLLGVLMSDAVEFDDVPVGAYWPQVPAGPIAEPAPSNDGMTLVSGSMSKADIFVQGVGWGTRLLLASGNLLIAIACIAVALLVHRACTDLLVEDPFNSTLRRRAWWTAIIVLVAGFGGGLLQFMAQAQAGNAALPWWRVDPNAAPEVRGPDEVDVETEGTQAMPLPDGPHFGGGEIAFTPLWVAIVIIVVVELLNAGVKLAADKARLAKDVEGLV